MASQITNATVLVNASLPAERLVRRAGGVTGIARLGRSDQSGRMANSVTHHTRI